MKSWKVITICFCLVLLYPMASVSAAVLNANPGKANSSITKCMSKAVAGDIIMLEAGMYTATASGGYETFPIQVSPGVAIVGHAINCSKIYSSDSIVFSGDLRGVTFENIFMETEVDPVVSLTAGEGPGTITFKNSRFVSSMHQPSNCDGTIRVFNEHYDAWNIKVVIENCDIITGNGNAGITLVYVDDIRIADSTLRHEAGEPDDYGVITYTSGHCNLSNLKIHGFPRAVSAMMYASSIEMSNIETDASVRVRGERNMAMSTGSIRSSKITQVIAYDAAVDVALTRIEGPEPFLAYETGVIRAFQCYNSDLLPIYP